MDDAPLTPNDKCALTGCLRQIHPPPGRTVIDVQSFMGVNVRDREPVEIGFVLAEQRVAVVSGEFLDRKARIRRAHDLQANAVDSVS